jgi:hypothetical protein
VKDPNVELTEILQQMANITRMRRGTLTEQYNRKTDEQGKERTWGPYYTLQAWVDGKNRSERVPRENAQQVREDIQHYQAFAELCERYIQTAEGVARQDDPDGKKKPSPPRRRSGGKPPRS